MPWNDNANPGPWGSPPPSGDGDRRGEPERGSPGGPGGPSFDPGFGRMRRRLGDLLNRGGGLRPNVIGAIIAAVVGLWLLSGFYIVQPNEKGVVLRFGKFAGLSEPGLRYHLPGPIEQVIKTPLRTLNRIDVGGDKSADTQASLMITGDQDIVDLNFSVFWRIADPAKYLFATRQPEEAVEAVAESAMREVVGKTSFNEISTSGRSRVQQQCAELMQRILDSWGAGITVVEVQLRSADTPDPVKASFRDVTRADQDREAAVNEGAKYFNRVVNEARGDAAKIIQSAEAYRSQAELEARGDAARFNQLVAEYKKAPGVTRDRLYIETMQRVLENSNKVVVDAKGATAPIILPPDAFKSRAAAAPSAPPPAPAPSQPPAQAAPAGKAGQ